MLSFFSLAVIIAKATPPRCLKVDSQSKPPHNLHATNIGERRPTRDVMLRVCVACDHSPSERSNIASGPHTVQSVSIGLSAACSPRRITPSVAARGACCLLDVSHRNNSAHSAVDLTDGTHATTPRQTSTANGYIAPASGQESNSNNNNNNTNRRVLSRARDGQ